MAKEDLVDAMEYILDLLEVDANSPFLIIAGSIIILLLNLFIIHKLSYLSHAHKLEDGLVAILYYVFEALNFIIAFLFIDVLLKTYNKSRPLRYAFAFLLSVINPLIFSIVFY